ncbi:MAG TPA: hypothetical protein VIY49_17200 [Bryobacteraceae bacterium]
MLASTIATLPLTPDPTLCDHCGEPASQGTHHHPLDEYRVRFESAVIVVWTPLSLTQSEIADWAWDSLGRECPRPRFVSVEYLGGAWSDDPARATPSIPPHSIRLDHISAAAALCA